jgi:hypothetical protein
MHETGPVRCKWESNITIEFHPKGALKMQTGLNWLRIGSVGELLWWQWWTFIFWNGICKMSLKCTNIKPHYISSVTGEPRSILNQQEGVFNEDQSYKLQFVTWDYCIYSFPSSASGICFFNRKRIHILPTQINIHPCIVYDLVEFIIQEAKAHSGLWRYWWQW